MFVFILWFKVIRQTYFSLQLLTNVPFCSTFKEGRWEGGAPSFHGHALEVRWCYPTTLWWSITLTKTLLSFKSFKLQLRRHVQYFVRTNWMCGSLLMISLCHIALCHCTSLTVKSQLSHKVFFVLFFSPVRLKPDVGNQHLFEQRSAL